MIGRGARRVALFSCALGLWACGRSMPDLVPAYELAGAGAGGAVGGHGGSSSGGVSAGAPPMAGIGGVGGVVVGGQGGFFQGGTSSGFAGAGQSGGGFAGALVGGAGAGGFGGGIGGVSGDSGMSGGGAGGSPVLGLLGTPYVHSTTAESFVLNAAVSGGAPGDLRAYVREPGAPGWTLLPPLAPPTTDVIEWSATGLTGGTRYDYDVTGFFDGREVDLYSGHIVTERAPGSTFVFSLITDTHIAPRLDVATASETDTSMESTLVQVTPDVLADAPDFVINLGDILDFHMFGFNEPPPDPSWTRLGYLNYRRLLGDTLGNATHFPVIGNWDGENGCNTLEQIERSRSQRLIYLPGPKPDTYPEGGSPFEDYYAFTWGDALFIVLNVMTYTPSCHLLGTYPGLPDDWTLGDAQLAWLRQTLENATSKWRFTFIHHTVGGNGGNDVDSAYGRGGGRAAYVGEQAIIQDLLTTYGVQIFFYAHDHVFTDMVVNGVHYTLPGSAGAPWKFTTYETGYEDFWSDSGHARVTVSPDDVNVELVAQGGSVLSSYTLP